MGRQTNIEILVQQNGRWTIHARYPVTKKDAAIEEAKALDRMPGIGSVKVIKDVYDPDSGTSNEYVIFKSTGVKSAAPAPAPAGGGAAAKPQAPAPKPAAKPQPAPAARAAPSPAASEPSGEEAPRTRPKRGRKRRTTSIAGIMVRLLMVLAFAIGIASGVTGLAVFALKDDVIFGISMVGDSGANVFFAIFVVTFLVSASVMAAVFLRKVHLADTPAARQAAQPAQKRPATRAPVPAPSAAPIPSGAEQAMAPAELPAGTPEGQQATKDVVEAAKAAERQATENAAPQQAAMPGDTGDGIRPPDALSPQAEKQKGYMLKFLGESLESVSSERKKMDNFTKFGVNLYLAGACEVLSQKRSLNAKERGRILSDGVQVLGFKRENAGQFADNYESYLLQDARYMQMFQAGRNAMNTYFTDEKSGPKHLETALTDWTKPKPKEAENQVVTVMFTDMVGSTALTQTKGQQVAQQVVRAHNRIVREALTQYGGREIKHTGDGIMCSFAQASSAVDAAIYIQRGTMQHNNENPELPLHLKIGLNTGEPIAEDGDLFGSTVQLAARITDKAKSEEIFVPDSVRIVCAGKNYKFVSRGGYSMKGFDGDIVLYEVVWDAAFHAKKQAATAQAASTPATPPAAAPAAARPAAAPARPAAAPAAARPAAAVRTIARPGAAAAMPPRAATQAS